MLSSLPVGRFRPHSAACHGTPLGPLKEDLGGTLTCYGPPEKGAAPVSAIFPSDFSGMCFDLGVCRINKTALGGSDCGGLAEWSNAPVLKTGGRESVPRVRIPEPPPFTPYDILISCGYIARLNRCSQTCFHGGALSTCREISPCHSGQSIFHR